MDKAGENTCRDLIVERLNVWRVSERKRNVEVFYSVCIDSCERVLINIASTLYSFEYKIFEIVIP